MKKEKYELSEIEVLRFESIEVITASNFNPGDDETEPGLDPFD